jgi:hypothetical protein
MKKPAAGGRRRQTFQEWQFSLRGRWFHVKVWGPPEQVKVVSIDDGGCVQSREVSLDGRDADDVALSLAHDLLSTGVPLATR